VLSAHKTGHEKADAFLFQFYIDKIKPTEIRVIRRKRKSKKRATNEMPVLQAIEAPGAKGGPGSSRKPKRLGKRSLPSICSPKAAAKPGRTRPHTLEPANISPPENKRPKLLLNEPEPREGVPEYEIKLMECQNKRKAEKREMMGLPPLNPYYCKDFGSKDCCFSSIYWASMRRHFDSKHPEIVLKLPKEANRHACSCGRTFLEPNRLQEHMESANHKATVVENTGGDDEDDEEGKENVDDDDVTNWEFYVQN